MKSEARTVAAYLRELPATRRDAVRELTRRIVAGSPGCEATMKHGMPFYEMAGDAYIAVASQKHYVSLYVVGLEEILEGHPEIAGPLLAVAGVSGKSCLRFPPSRLERIPWPAVEQLVAAAHRRFTAEGPC